MILIDANVFMYAAGSAHDNKVSSVKLLHEAASRPNDFCVNTEILQEILHRYRSIGRWEDGSEVYVLARKIVPIAEPVTHEIIEAAFALMVNYPNLMARDCVHAAHCISSKLEGICSFDTDFDRIREIVRIAPE